MSTDGSSLGWSDLLESRPLSSSSDEATTVQMSPRQTLPNSLLTEELTLPSLEDQPGKLAENLSVKNTYIIYSVGNATLFMNTLDTQLATEHQLELLDRHLLDVKIADPVAPLCPNPDVITVGMRNSTDGDVPCTSTASAASSATHRKYHSKMRYVKLLSKNKRSKLHS